MDQVRYMISDASKLVEVESHVLRYWEEELELPIARNEMGHRYYTEDHIRVFETIKNMKLQGFPLKSIKDSLEQGHTTVELAEEKRGCPYHFYNHRRGKGRGERGNGD